MNSLLQLSKCKIWCEIWHVSMCHPTGLSLFSNNHWVNFQLCSECFLCLNSPLSKADTYSNLTEKKQKSITMVENKIATWYFLRCGRSVFNDYVTVCVCVCIIFSWRALQWKFWLYMTPHVTKQKLELKDISLYASFDTIVEYKRFTSYNLRAK